MKSFKVYVELGEYVGGYDSIMGGRGAWESSTSKQFETVVQAQHYQQAETIARAQYGGHANCKVWVRGEV